ncbi:hypothetical protein [Corynebacterium sp.]|uniref:hypothetical protein n=1 Tax=Corynebacterium sp. TaxID=1720 RepID=UPI0026DB57C6|nr:hypothetical protein [Corynebacterium sp.]MDO5031097.1 hypothetical protein [Corynebacterium sp.]
MNEPEPNQSRPLDRTPHTPPPVPHTVDEVRARNEPALRDLAMIGVPAGIAIGLSQVEFGLQVPLIAACWVFIVFGVLGLIRRWPTSIQAERSEVRSGDYAAVAYWAPFLPIVVPIAGGALSSLGLTEDLTFNPILVAVGYGLWSAPAIVLGGWALFNSSYRIGRRRIKQINADPSLDGVTAESIEATIAHRPIVSALVAAGAVDGNTVILKRLRKLVRYDDGLKEDLRELEKVGVVKLIGTRIGSNAERTWQVTLTKEGVRCMREAAKR